MSTKQGNDLGKERHGYFEESRSFGLSILSVLPLVVLYHWGIIRAGSPVRNLAELWLEGPLHLVGLEAAHVLNLALLAAFLAVLWRSGRGRSLSPVIIVAMIAEGFFYAAALLRGGEALTDAIYAHTRQVTFAINLHSPRLLLALGAGVYEELFFRLMLVGGGSLLLKKVFLWDRGWSVGTALVISSLLFAGAHHIGPMGELPDAYSFLFRTVCGMLLGVVYLWRGFGVAVWTHAIYNALVIV